MLGRRKEVGCITCVYGPHACPKDAAYVPHPRFGVLSLLTCFVPGSSFAFCPRLQATA